MRILLGWTKFCPVLSISLIAACCSGPQAYDVKLSFNQDDFKDNAGRVIPVEVDMIPVSDAKSWSEMGVNQYFKDGTEDHHRRVTYLREHTLVTLTFSDTTPGPLVFPRTHPLWATSLQQGAKELVVLAELPGQHWRDKPEDPRRLVLPLNSSNWSGKEIEIRVMPRELKLLTNMKNVK